jgi:hypothetical protein
MSAPGDSVSRTNVLRASERYGLRLVEPPGRKSVTGAAHKSFSLESRSSSNWLVSGAFTGILFAYVTGLGLLARWLLRWLISA